MHNYLIILAAGSGQRLGTKVPKCFVKVNGKPIYQYSLQQLNSKKINKIILVVPKQFLHKIQNLKSNILAVSGGKTRNESFECGMRALSNLDPTDKIIIHDAARIFVTKKDISKIIDSKEDFGTLCYIGKKNMRDLRIDKYNIQTPQFCKYFIYKQCKRKNNKGRDLFTYLNLKPKPYNFIISSGKERNLKITYKQDLFKAKSL